MKGKLAKPLSTKSAFHVNFNDFPLSDREAHVKETQCEFDLYEIKEWSFQ